MTITNTLLKQITKDITKSVSNENTRKTSLSYLKTVIVGVNIKKITEFKTKIPQIKTFIEGRYSKNTRRSVYSSIVSLIRNKRGYKESVEQFRTLMNIEREDREKVLSKQQVPEKLQQEFKNIQWDDLQKQFKSTVSKQLVISLTKTKKFKESMRLYELYVLGLLLFQSGFIERLSYSSFKFGKRSDSGNIIDLNEGIMIFRDYKTSRTYGEQTRHLPKHIVDGIKKYKSFKPNKEYLFFNDKFKTPKVYTNSRFSDLVVSLGKAMGNKVSLTIKDYRLMFEIFTQGTSTYHNLSREQRDELHPLIAFHSRKEAEKEYNKKFLESK